MFEQVDNSGGVTVFVIVPGNKLDESWGQLDTSLGVEDGTSGVGEEIGGDDFFVGVTQETSQWTFFGGLLDNSTDFFVGGFLLQVDGQVNNGDVDGWDSEGHTGQLTLQFWQDLTDGLGGTGGGWDDVTGGGSTTSPVLVGRTVDGLLGGGQGVDGGHQTGLDTEVIVDNLGQWGQTVGGTGGVGQDLDVGGVLVVVDTHDEHWGVGRRSGDDNLLGTGVQVLGGTGDVLEDTGGVDNVVDAGGTPGDVFWVSFLEHLDLVVVDDQVLAFVRDGTLVLTVGGVVLEHVGGVFWGNERIIDGDDLDVWSGEGDSEDKSADSAEPVDTDSDSHVSCS